ncbi:helix-turn-helix transcriptional regulator [Streptomyces sp. NPDC059524]|uniref:helix-turn-helix transcriptional regulator n=1 Tax=Streptomyces sp. NPDC059524 TaxID=3346856 RepID=UPI0036A1578B
MTAAPEPHTGWTFLTNHARVLSAVATEPTLRIRDIAAHCRLTERAVQKILADLEKDGYLTHTRRGRSNTYRVSDGTILRHPAEAGLTVSDLLGMLARHDAEHAEDGAPVSEDRVRLQ